MLKRLALSLVAIRILSPDLLAQDSADEAPMLDAMEVFGSVSEYQNWPLTASAISGDEVDLWGSRDVRDMADYVPSFSQTDSGLRAFGDVISMRGMTNTPFFSAPSVIMYVDDVPMSNVSTYATSLNALDRVEIFRGPQGALFGRNSYGGVLNIITREPGDELEGSFGATYGSDDLVGVDGFLMGPINEQLSFRLGASYVERDGYVWNTTLREKTDHQEQLNIFGGLYWRPADDWTVSLTGSWENIDDGDPRLALLTGDPFRIQSNIAGLNQQESSNQALRIKYEGTDYEFLAVTAHRTWEVDPYLFDLDFTAFPLASSRIYQEQDLWTQELRWRSIPGSSDWDWTTGAYFSNLAIDGGTAREFPVFVDPLMPPLILNTTTDYELDEQNYAAFGQLTYGALDRWGFHFGLRVDYWDKELSRDAVGVAGPVPRIEQEEDFLHVSPSIGVDYEINDTSLVYVNTALAHKPGGFSAFVDDPTLAEFDTEQAWASEIGLKTSWLDDRIRTNVALFYSRIRDYQVERSLVATDYAVLNADRATSYGAEFEWRAELFEGFTLEGSLGLVETELDDFTDPVTGADLSGNNAPFVPELDLSLAAVYRHSSGFFGRVELLHQGRTFFNDQNTPAFKEDGYTVLNASLGYESDTWQVSFFGQNLGDERYYKNISPDLGAGTVGEPQRFGVKYRFDF
ncbi:MAG: TonB-dependent receptor [Verrucomicrobiota bacterium]